MIRVAVGLGIVIAVGAPVGPAVPATVAASPACATGTAIAAPPDQRPRYSMRIHVARGLTAAEGKLSVTFTPDVATDRVVFRLWPNSPFYARRGARLTVSDVTSVGRAVSTVMPDPTTLVIRRSLAAHERIVLSMKWALRLPRSDGLQLHGGRAARLVSFFPLLAWNGSGWATEAPVRMDSFWPTSPTADFDVDVSVPQGGQVLATGEEVGGGRWRARAVRDFALAVGSFRVVSTTVRAPRPVRITVGVERGSAASPTGFLAAAARSLRSFADRFGEYPWPAYSIAVTRDFQGLNGTAYPTIGFLGDSSLVLVPHETAHQWFASLVGNDQSRDPWLSEGLATWAQAGAEGSLSSLLATPVPSQVENRIGEPMSFWQSYDFETLRAGLYVQTVQALAELGSASRVDCALRAFVARNAYRTAVPRALLASLTRLFPDAEQRLRKRGARF